MQATTPLGIKAAISWSAGKDSCLALIRCLERGMSVPTFVTMCEPTGDSKSHALPPDIVAAQVQGFGAQCQRVYVPDGAYAATFNATLNELRSSGHTHMVFGDIDLQAHRDWLEPACSAAGLQALFPLWGEPRAELALEVIGRGIRARVVCVDNASLDASFCGLDYDAAFLSTLPPEVCPCGEDGEFHTFVYDAPVMAFPLVVRNTRQVAVPSAPPLRPTTLVFQGLDWCIGNKT